MQIPPSPIQRRLAALIFLTTLLGPVSLLGAGQYTYSHLAGSAGGAGADDGAGSSARFYRPGGVAVDLTGMIYVADTSNNLIRKITPTGDVTTVAGSATVSGSADGIGAAARFNHPSRMAVDSAGDLIVADTGNHTIRKVTPAGDVSTIAGTAGTAGSADGVGAAATFNHPAAVAVDSSDNIYVADTENDTIRKITPAGVVTTFAGLAGHSGVTDGTGSAARFFSPEGIVVDMAGNVFVSDTGNHTLRKITPARVVTTFVGSAGSAGGADGTGGSATLTLPAGLAIDSAANLYVAQGTTVRKVTPAGVVTTLAGASNQGGNVDGHAGSARFTEAEAVAVSPSGVVYVADQSASLIRTISATLDVSTFAGSVGAPGAIDAAGLAARFNYPYGLAVDGQGNVYVGELNNHTIRKITPAGVVSTLAGYAGLAGSADGTGSEARFNAPFGLAVDAAGNVFVADYWGDTIRKITPSGVVTTMAGAAGVAGDTDGPALDARFAGLTGLAIDGAGNLYATSATSHTIRKITPSGVVTTLAGTAGQQGDVDGVGAAARFNHPYGIAADTAGNLYVTESSGVVRKITPAAQVTTLAGTAGQSGSTDGVGATARFGGPIGVAVDAKGNVFVADSYNHTLREISPGGEVTTIGGIAGHDGATDGTAQDATFDFPCGIAVDHFGNLYIADSGNNAIRAGVDGNNTPPTITAPADQTVTEGGATAALAFTVGDVETSPEWLLVSATSSNHALIPDAAIALTGSGSERWVTVSPLAGQAGSSTITLTVSDGTLARSASFVVTVIALNGPPAISGIPDQQLTMNGISAPVGFKVTDVDTPAASLVLTAGSSDPALVPTDGITFAGSGEDRTIQITPAANVVGTATILVTVSDGVREASTQFDVSVLPPQPPTISSIDDVGIAAGHMSDAIPFTIADPDTPAAELTITTKSSNSRVVSSDGIVIGGSGASRTLQITPVAGAHGRCAIYVTVHDGERMATTKFVVTILGNANPTISPISNQGILVGVTSGPISFVIGDADTAVSKLTLTAKSSNPRLIPSANVAFSGSGSRRTLTLKPLAGMEGRSTIFVTVHDGPRVATAHFVATVSTHASPTIGAIDDQYVAVNGASAPIRFTIGDADTPAGNLRVSASSSNRTVLSPNRITFGGSGANRTVQITPWAHRVGTSKVTIRVSDGARTAETTFNVTVEAPATITTVADQIITRNTSTAPLSFVIDDQDTWISHLWVRAASSNTAVVPASGIKLTGSGAIRAVQITPAADRTGSAVITLRVCDGGLWTQEQFKVTVTN